MKVAFLVPPSLDGQLTADRVAGCARSLYPIPNLFELTAAATVEAAGFEVSYHNFPINGLAEGEFDQFLKADQSDVYAIYGVNLTKQTDTFALGKIRKARPGAHVVFYGPSPTYTPTDYLLFERTYVVRGEPEHTLAELVSSLSRGKDPADVLGVSFRSNGTARENGFRPLIDNLDSLPFQAVHLTDEHKHKYCNPKLGAKPLASMMTSRNCPFRCIYCVPCSHSFARELEYKRFFNTKPPIRKRSAENVVSEVEMLARNGYKAICFQDDLFIMGKSRTIDICKGIEKFAIRWGCATRADTIDDDVVGAMAKAGCAYIDLGIESFHPEILKDIHKDLDPACIAPAIRTIKKHRIRAKVNVLLGASPLETVETIKYSMEEVKRLDADQVMYNIANPFPGTELYEMAKRNGWFVKGDYYPSDVQKEAIMNLPNISGEQLVRLVKKGNRAFFLNPRFILRNVKNFETFDDFLDALRALWKKLV